MKKYIFCIFVILPCIKSQAARIRSITFQTDSILNVKTALGIATIVQIPEVIGSAIIGDQSGFKVEYLDKAVTIKPLRFGAKTNLYLVTDSRRYNIRLTTESQELADYIVYVKDSVPKNSKIKWISFRKFSESNGTRMNIGRIGISENGFILIDGQISVSNSNTIQLKPQDIWIKQNGVSKVINGLYLSQLKVSKKNPATIGISLAKSDLISKSPVTVEIKSIPNLSVILTESILWK